MFFATRGDNTKVLPTLDYTRSASHNLKIDSEKTNITKGKPKEITVTGSSGKPVHRFFCGDCGTPVWTNADAMAGASFVKVGPLGDFGNRVTMTIEAWAENANPNTLRLVSLFETRSRAMLNLNFTPHQPAYKASRCVIPAYQGRRLVQETLPAAAHGTTV